MSDPPGSRSQRLSVDNRRRMQLTARDTEIIRAAHDYRALTAAQLQVLFDMSRSPVQRRLLALFEHGYLDRQEVTVVGRTAVNMPILYTLGRRGVQVLVDRFSYDPETINRPKRQYAWKTVDHLMLLNNVRIAITVSAQAHGWNLETWLDEQVFRQVPEYVELSDSTGKPQQKPVYPDGYFCLVDPHGRAHYFVEIDRGTESRSEFRPQILVYEQYVRSGQYQARFSKTSLTILIVTTTPSRLATLKSWVASAGGDDKYWFALREDISAETVLTAPIWQRLTETTCVPLVEPVN